MKNYALYFPENKSLSYFPLTVHESGFTRVPPRSSYPLLKHPSRYDLSQGKGRKLDHYQLVYISAGEGIFESDLSGKIPIKAGSILFLFPQIGHRYSPDKTTGWTEHWFGFSGDLVKELAIQKQLDSQSPVISQSSDLSMVQLFENFHQYAISEPSGRTLLLSTMAAHILARSLRHHMRGSSLIQKKLHSFESKLTENNSGKISAFAKESGIPYSSLRRRFRQETGLSPKQYQIEIRIQSACELLKNSRLSITQIAETLGFDSPFHFSNQFKKRLGTSPFHWRTSYR